jgi:hypothetical protein
MTGWLDRHRPADQGAQFVQRRPGLQGGPQVYLCIRQQAGPQLAVSRQSQPVATVAKVAAFQNKTGCT